MSEYQDNINRHYGRRELSASIIQALRDAGKDLNKLTRDDIIAFEEFHIGGRRETRILAKAAALRNGLTVLDIGSGVGGPARTLAEEFGCEVMGLDYTQEYCEAASMLTRLTGLDSKVQFRHGNALEIPFAENSFNAVWMQHTVANIEDTDKLFSEIRRVLRPWGSYIFHEVMEGNGNNIHYPVFWANDPSIDFLKRPERIQTILMDHGFQKIYWEDVSARSLEWFKRMADKMDRGGLPELNLSLIVGDDMSRKSRNVIRNLEEGNISVIQAVYTVSK